MDLSGEPAFPEVAARVRRTLGESIAHHLPFAELVESALSDEDAQNLSLRGVGFSMRAFRDQCGRWPGLSASVWEHEVDNLTYELALMVHPGPEETTLYLNYRRDRFAPETIATLADHFRTLAERVAHAPQTPCTSWSCSPTPSANGCCASGTTPRRRTRTWPCPSFWNGEPRATRTPWPCSSRDGN